MRELVAKTLWIGNAFDIRGDSSGLFEQGVQSVVDLAYEESPALLPRELIYLRVPLHDDDSNPHTTVRIAAQTVASLLESDVPVLVACGAGLSRSPAIAAVAYAIAKREEPNAVLADLLRDKPRDLSPGFWKNAIESSRDLLPENGSA